MHKLLQIVVMVLATLHLSVAARAQTSEFEGSVQLRLKNSLPEKIDYYFTPEGGSPNWPVRLVREPASMSNRSRASYGCLRRTESRFRNIRHAPSVSSN
jgi:hypothetical protein